MIYIFTILGTLGVILSLLNIGMMFYDIEMFRQYSNVKLDSIIGFGLGSLVFLAIGRMMAQLNDIYEKLTQGDEKRTNRYIMGQLDDLQRKLGKGDDKSVVSYKKDLGNWPPSA